MEAFEDHTLSFLESMNRFHNTIILVLALLAPSFARPQSTKGFTINEFEQDGPNSNHYSINSQKLYKDGKCIRETKVSGSGIKDAFEAPCNNNGQSSIRTDDKLIFGNPKYDDSLTLYSDTPKTLIVIMDGKCTKKEYTVSGSDVSSTSSPLTDSDCSQMKQKVEDEIRKNRVGYEEWHTNYQAHLASTYGNDHSTLSNNNVEGAEPTDDDEYFIEDTNNDNNGNLETDNDGTDIQSNNYQLDEPEDVADEEPEDVASDEGYQDLGHSISDYWKNWAQNFKQEMQQAFPPGFPFHNKKQ